MKSARASVARQIVAGALALAVVALIAFLGTLATTPNTEGWYADVNKVAWSPPNWVFGPAWSVLYILIALAGFLIWRAGYRHEKRNAARSTLTLYIVQLALNALWTPIFFAGFPLTGKFAWWVALLVILALIAVVLVLGISASKWSKWAAWIMLPYALWLIFASTLNAGIIVLN